MDAAGARSGYWSGRPPAEPFHLFGPAHLATMGAIGVGIASLRCLKNKTDAVRRRATAAIVAAMWAQELGYWAWRAGTGRWSIQEMLPVHACSVAIWAGGVGAFTGNRTLRDYGYYVGVAGAGQAIVTPDLAEYGPRNIQFVQFFLSHALLVALGVQLVVNEGHRPTWPGMVRTWSLMVVQALAAHALNKRIGSNYMYVTRKPETASLLDKLPPWPGYLPILAGVVGGALGALTLPFAGLPGRRRTSER